MAEDELKIIGKIPGYNKNIDQGGVFEKNLLKGITYIDMYPTAYQSNLKMAEAAGAASADDLSMIKVFGTAVEEIFTSPGLVKSIPPSAPAAGVSKDPSAKLFKQILDRMEAKFSLGSGFANAKALRLIAANDSTFTEVFSNSFDGENAAVSAFNKGRDAVQGSIIGQITKGSKTFNSTDLANLVGAAHKYGTGSSFMNELMIGAVLGMNIAAPQIWSASQYNSTLTLFIKLVSPTGQEECIKKNILEPLLYLIAASSPITAYGVVYGFPLLWQVQAHGITSFRIGSIAALSIIRGSFETTFTKTLQPTVVDVRLTIIPLLTDFAVQTNVEGVDSIYDKTEFLGVQNPADIERGILNKKPIGHDKTKVDIVSVKL